MNQTVCLSMIVKNEAHVIERCLQSVVNIVDYYMIVDTGSTDKTIEVIESFIAKNGGKGKVASREWKDFGTNRTEALDLARSEFAICPDYALVMDADDILEIKNLSLVKSALGLADAYELPVVSGKWKWNRCHFFRLVKPFVYKDTLHEYAACSEPFTKMAMPGVEYVCIGGGGRHVDPNLFDQEVALLRKQIERDGVNTRALYLLGQGYYFNNKIDEAIATFKERLSIQSGWTEEKFLSALWLGEIYESKDEWGQAEYYYKIACMLNPSRAEAFEKLARHYRIKADENWGVISYRFALKGASLKPDPNALNLDNNIHDYKIVEELALAAYEIGKYEESLAACGRLLKAKTTPVCCQYRVEDLLGLIRDKIIEKSNENRIARPNFRVVISFTTLPSRYSILEKTISSIQHQSFEADAIYLCLPEFSDREQVKYETPDFLPDNIIILKSDKDYGPATKLYATLKQETDLDTLIVTVDDDIIYHPLWLERIVNQALIYPDSAIGFAAWNVKQNVKENETPYKFMYEEISNFSSGNKVNILEGYRGVGYRRKFFDNSIVNYSNYPTESKYQDDIWFGGHLAIKQIPKRVITFRADQRLTSKEVWNQIWICIDDPNALSQRHDFTKISKTTINGFGKIWETELEVKESTNENVNVHA